MSASTLLDSETGQIYDRYIPSSISELGAANTARVMDSTGETAEWSKITTSNISANGATAGYVLTAAANDTVLFAAIGQGEGELNAINTDDTPITIVNNEISILGSGNITTDGTGASEMTISLQNIDAGAVLIGGQTNTIDNIGASGAGKFLQVDGSTEWTESNIILPLTTTQNCVLYSTASDNVSETNTLADAVLITSAASVPAFSATLPAVDGSLLTNINATTIDCDDDVSDYHPLTFATATSGAFLGIANSTTGPRSSLTAHGQTGEIRQATDLITEINFLRQVSGYVSSRLYHDASNITLQCLQLQESTVGGRLNFGQPLVSGSRLDGYQFLNQGLIVGDSVSGGNDGNMGMGTINIAGTGDIYKDGVAYLNPDYVCELYCHGKVDKTRHRPGATTYVRKSIEETEEIMQKTLKLPNMPNDDDKIGMFGIASILLEKIEEATIHIFELNKKIKALQHEVQNCKKIK